MHLKQTPGQCYIGAFTTYFCPKCVLLKLLNTFTISNVRGLMKLDLVFLIYGNKESVLTIEATASVVCAIVQFLSTMYNIYFNFRMAWCQL